MRAARALCLALSLAGSALLAGCDTVGYYFQSVSGHLSLMAQRESIDQAIDNTQEILRNLDRVLRTEQDRVFDTDCSGLSRLRPRD